MLDKKFGAPLITNDGVTIAKEIELKIRSRTWAHSWCRKSPPRPTTWPATAPPPQPCWHRPWSRGHEERGRRRQPHGHEEGHQKAVEAVEAIKAAQPEGQGTNDIARVGTISAGDDDIGKLIAEAMEKVTADGVITIEESKTAETYSEVVEGMQFDRGYITPYMVTDTDKMEAVLDDAVHPHHR